MKKAISLLLSLLMVCSTFVGLGITAGAETTENSITPLALNTTFDVVIDEAEKYVKFSFTPEEDGVYVFYSISNIDTRVYLYDAEGEYIDEDDDNGEGNNFKIVCKLTAGTTYIYEVGCYGDGMGEFEVCLEENPVESIEVLSEIPAYYGYGYWSSYYDEELEEDVEYFFYTPVVKNANIQINFKDGSNVTTTVDEGYDDLQIEYSHSQEETPWTEGGENSITFTYMCVSATVSAIIQESPFESIEYVNEKITLVENYNGEWQEYEHSDTGETHDYFYYSINVDNLFVRVNYKDGTFEEVNINDSVGGVDLFWRTNQDVKHWTLGEDNSITVSLLDQETTIPVTIVENPISSIEVVSDPLTLIENNSGYWETEDSGEFFYYYFDVNDINIKVNFADGTSDVYNFDDEVLGYYFDYYGNQYSKHWTVDGNNYFTIELAGVTTTAPVIITESPVDSIEYVSGEVLTYNDCGYWDERYDSETDECEEFFVYSYRVADVKIKVNYKNGTSDVAFVNSVLNGYKIEYNDNQCEEPWLMDKTNYLTVTYLGKVIEIPVTIKTQEPIQMEVGKNTALIDIERKTVAFTFTPKVDGKYTFYSNTSNDTYGYLYDGDGNLLAQDDDSGIETNFYISYDMKANETYTYKARFYNSSKTGSFDVYLELDPIKSLEVVSDPIVCYEGYGYESEREDEDGNIVTYFNYYFTTQTVKIKINYIDGTSVVIDDIPSDYNGYYFYCDDNQYNNPWKVDSENYITVTYAGNEVKVPVVISENNVVSLEYVSGEITCYKDYGYYYDEEETDFYYYYIPYNVKVKVNYSDGTSVIADVSDTVNGYEFDYRDNQPEEPWTVDGENYVEVGYLNSNITVPVRIIDNPVESIEVVTPPLVFTENEGGEYTEDEDGKEFYYYFMSYYNTQLSSTVVKVNYKDGTSKTCNIKEKLDGYYFEWYSTQYDQHWTVGTENYLMVDYLGVKGKIPVTIVAKNEPAKPTTITLAKSSATLYVTGTTNVKATVTNGVGTTTYKSSNTKVATVNANGKITAKKKGTATITVTNNGVSKKFKITVKKPTLNSKKQTLTVGKKFKLKITGKIGKATFISTKPKIVKVNKNGKIVAKAKGRATIKVKVNGVTLKCKVKVK